MRAIGLPVILVYLECPLEYPLVIPTDRLDPSAAAARIREVAGLGSSGAGSSKGGARG